MDLVPRNGQLPQAARERVSALLSDFLSRRSDKTRRAYEGDLRHFAAFLSVPSPLEAVSRLLSLPVGEANSLAMSYRSRMVEGGLAAATVNRRLAALRSVSRMGRVIGLVPWTLEVESEKAQSYRDTRGPGRNALLRMVSSLKASSTGKGRRDYAILRLLLDLALRRGEIVSLGLEDVDLNEGRIMILGKGRNKREPLSLPRETRDALSAWISVRGGGPGPLFTNFDRAGKGSGSLTGAAVYYIVRGLGETAGVKARPHGIRHTAITEVLSLSGGDVRKAARFSRHRDLRTLTRYDDALSDLGGDAARILASSFPG
jgi:integrase/recombinase XerC